MADTEALSFALECAVEHRVKEISQAALAGSLLDFHCADSGDAGGEETLSSSVSALRLKISLVRLSTVLLFRVPKIPELLCPTNDGINNLVMFGRC
jgi:hypothetical protein